jgi:hypothetical protein
MKLLALLVVAAFLSLICAEVIHLTPETFDEYVDFRALIT